MKVTLKDDIDNKQILNKNYNNNIDKTGNRIDTKIRYK